MGEETERDKSIGTQVVRMESSPKCGKGLSQDSTTTTAKLILGFCASSSSCSCSGQHPFGGMSSPKTTTTTTMTSSSKANPSSKTTHHQHLLVVLDDRQRQIKWYKLLQRFLQQTTTTTTTSTTTAAATAERSCCSEDEEEEEDCPGTAEGTAATATSARRYRRWFNMMVASAALVGISSSSSPFPMSHAIPSFHSRHHRHQHHRLIQQRQHRMIDRQQQQHQRNMYDSGVLSHRGGDHRHPPPVPRGSTTTQQQQQQHPQQQKPQQHPQQAPQQPKNQSYSNVGGGLRVKQTKQRQVPPPPQRRSVFLPFQAFRIRTLQHRLPTTPPPPPPLYNQQQQHKTFPPSPPPSEQQQQQQPHSSWGRTDTGSSATTTTTEHFLSSLPLEQVPPPQQQHQQHDDFQGNEERNIDAAESVTRKPVPSVNGQYTNVNAAENRPHEQVRKIQSDLIDLVRTNYRQRSLKHLHHWQQPPPQHLTSSGTNDMSNAEPLQSQTIGHSTAAPTAAANTLEEDNGDIVLRSINEHAVDAIRNHDVGTFSYFASTVSLLTPARMIKSETVDDDDNKSQRLSHTNIISLGEMGHVRGTKETAMLKNEYDEITTDDDQEEEEEYFNEEEEEVLLSTEEETGPMGLQDWFRATSSFAFPSPGWSIHAREGFVAHTHPFISSALYWFSKQQQQQYQTQLSDQLVQLKKRHNDVQESLRRQNIFHLQKLQQQEEEEQRERLRRHRPIPLLLAKLLDKNGNTDDFDLTDEEFDLLLEHLKREPIYDDISEDEAGDNQVEFETEQQEDVDFFEPAPFRLPTFNGLKPAYRYRQKFAMPNLQLCDLEEHFDKHDEELLLQAEEDRQQRPWRKRRQTRSKATDKDEDDDDSMNKGDVWILYVSNKQALDHCDRECVTEMDLVPTHGMRRGAGSSNSRENINANYNVYYDLELPY